MIPLLCGKRISVCFIAFWIVVVFLEVFLERKSHFKYSSTSLESTSIPLVSHHLVTLGFFVLYYFLFNL